MAPADQSCQSSQPEQWVVGALLETHRDIALGDRHALMKSRIDVPGPGGSVAVADLLPEQPIETAVNGLETTYERLRAGGIGPPFPPTCDGRQRGQATNRCEIAHRRGGAVDLNETGNARQSKEI
jgi:hypothetical protein